MLCGSRRRVYHLLPLHVTGMYKSLVHNTANVPLYEAGYEAGVWACVSDSALDACIQGFSRVDTQPKVKWESFAMFVNSLLE